MGCWLEFDGTELFRGATDNLGRIQQKPFTMRDTEQLRIFAEKMETHLTSKKGRVAIRVVSDRTFDMEPGDVDRRRGI